MKQPKFMVIRWLDASVEFEWKEEGEASHEPPVCYTAGWLVDENDDRLVLAQTIVDDKGHGHEWSIPIGCIKKRRVVKIALP